MVKNDAIDFLFYNMYLKFKSQLECFFFEEQRSNKNVSRTFGTLKILDTFFLVSRKSTPLDLYYMTSLNLINEKSAELKYTIITQNIKIYTSIQT